MKTLRKILAWSLLIGAKAIKYAAMILFGGFLAVLIGAFGYAIWCEIGWWLLLWVIVIPIGLLLALAALMTLADAFESVSEWVTNELRKP